jgi:hypothetical protein
MTKDETLQMALKFIERVNQDGWVLADFEPEMYACITAIKEALKTKDEFVAWEQFYPDIGKPQIAFNAEVVGYVAPQRTWVGLTDEDKQKLAAEHHDWES